MLITKWLTRRNSAVVPCVRLFQSNSDFLCGWRTRKIHWIKQKQSCDVSRSVSINWHKWSQMISYLPSRVCEVALEVFICACWFQYWSFNLNIDLLVLTFFLFLSLSLQTEWSCLTANCPIKLAFVLRMHLVDWFKSKTLLMLLFWRRSQRIH